MHRRRQQSAMSPRSIQSHHRSEEEPLEELSLSSGTMIFGVVVVCALCVDVMMVTVGAAVVLGWSFSQVMMSGRRTLKSSCQCCPFGVVVVGLHGSMGVVAQGCMVVFEGVAGVVVVVVSQEKVNHSTEEILPSWGAISSSTNIASVRSSSQPN